MQESKSRPIYVVELKRKKDVDMPPDVEKAFNEHYNNIHLSLMSKVPGVINICRYKAVSGTYLGTIMESDKYVAIYEIESEESIKQALSSPERKEALQDHGLMDYIKKYFTLSCTLYIPLKSISIRKDNLNLTERLI